MKSDNFFAELKRRNVYKVAVAYAIVAWLLIQIATQVFPFFEIPNWAVRLVVLLLILGFPIALFLAWAFEITPEGIKRAEDVDVNKSITHQTGRKLIWTTAVLAAIAAGLFAYQILRPQSAIAPAPSTASAGGAGSPAIAEKSIAVLPFDNLSDDKSNAYFAEGIQDEILTRLSKIAALKVISRTSTQKYKSAPDNLREVGRQLGVANLLEGSVQKVANAVHVNVQLIRAATDEHVWAESYNRKLDDVFGVEGEVASAIADQLNAKLTGAEEKAITDKPTQSAAAYDAYLRGLAIENSGDPNAPEKSAPDYTEAIRLDPEFALAWAHLAIARSRLYFNGIDLATNSGAAVKDAGDRALALQPELGEAWIAQGVYRYRVLRDFPAALQSYAEALKRLPNSSLVLEQMGHVERRLGEWDLAKKHFEAAAQLDPRNIEALSNLPDIYSTLRRFAEAEAAFDRILQISPGNETTLASKALLFQSEGRLSESANELSKIPADSQNDTVVLARTLHFMYEHRFDDAITQLKKSSASAIPNDPRTLTAVGYCQAWLGRKDQARASFNRAIAVMMPSGNSVVPIDARMLPSYLAWCYAGLGDKEKALKQAREAAADYESDLLSKPFAEQVLAQIQAYFGDFDSALAAIPHLLEVPGGVTRGSLRVDPFWDPLRKDPRFVKLMAEPQSN